MDVSETVDAVDIVRVHGVAIPLDPDVMSPKIQDQLRAGRYEAAEASVLPRVLQPADRVLELGAGIGFLTALAGLQGLAERVVAVEANPALTALIEQVHRLNGVAGVVRQGVAAIEAGGPSAAPFYVHRDLWASSVEPVKAKDLREVVQAPVAALPDLLAEFAPTLLIIDVEVLQGWCSEQAQDGSQIGALRLPGVDRVLIELKPGRFPPRQIKRIFDAFSADGFYYDPAVSAATVILFRRIEHQDAA